MVQKSENDASVQEEIFRTLLRTPHRRVDETIETHQQQFDRDPNFYGHLAVYAAHKGNCTIRDVNDVFIALLFASPFPEHRSAAYAMFQALPPYQAVRVMHYVTGYDEIVRHASYDPSIDGPGITTERMKYDDRHPASQRGKVIPSQTVNLGRKMMAELLRRKKIKATDQEFQVTRLWVHHACLNRQSALRGALGAAIRTYLRYREMPNNLPLLEGGLIRAKKFFKELYARRGLIPLDDKSSWLNQFLFYNRVQEGTRLAAVRQLRTVDDPTEQASIILEQRLPYPIVVSVLKNITPAVLVALVDVMSPQELLSNMNSLQRHGAMTDPEVKGFVTEKLKGIKEGKRARMDALKAATASDKVEGLDEETRKVMTSITDTQIKQHGTIKQKTALLVDKSLSMQAAIELAKRLGSVIAQACEDSSLLIAYMFDTMPTQIMWNSSDGDMTTQSAWKDKLKMFTASGGTDPSRVLQHMMMQNYQVDQICMITDEGENTEGRFALGMQEYVNKFGATNLVIVRVGDPRKGYLGGGSCDRISKSCSRLGIDNDVLRCENIDDIAIPNLVQLLSRKSIFELTQDILSLPLPTRQEWDDKHFHVKRGHTIKV